MKDISAAERAFIAALCDGNSKAEAFRIGFKRPHLPSTQASTSANRVLNKPQVKAFYDAEMQKLEAETHSKSLWSRERGIKDLLWVIEISKAAIKSTKDKSKDDDNKIQTPTAINAIIKCVELLDKMMGGESECDKSLARMLTDLDPDSITEDPLQYCAAGFKNE
jgi:hypothetical protein